MKKYSILRAAALLTALWFAHCAAASHAGTRRQLTAVVVKTRPGVDVRTVAAAHGAGVRDTAGPAIASLIVPKSSTVSSFASSLRRDPDVEDAEPDSEMRLQIHVGFDTGPGRDGYVNEAAFTMVNVDEALRLADGSGVRVAVLDTGVNPDHPAVAGHLGPGFNAIDPAAEPLDIPDGVQNSAAGHGTMVAGLIARMAPAAEILPIRVLNGDGTGSLIDVLEGVQYAIDQGARVLNISFSTPVESSLFESILDHAENAGMMVVASAGNDGTRQRRFPAGYGGSVGVASVDGGLRKSSFSNYGGAVAVVAPGEGIPGANWDGGYGVWSGTSVAVPFVSAAGALVFSRSNRMPADEAVEIIRSSARSVDGTNPRYRRQLGRGLINLERAVKAVDRH